MNTSATYDVLYNQAYANLLGKSFPGKFFRTFAPIACALDLLVVYTIYRTKDIHNKCHFLMLSLSLSHAVYSTQAILMGIWQQIRLLNSTPLVLPYWSCSLYGQVAFLPLSTYGALGLNLAIDRFMCVMTPIFYRQIDTRKYILIVNILAYTYVIPIVLVGVIGNDIYSVGDCERLGQVTYNIVGTTYMSNSGNVRAALLAGFYITAACGLMYRYKTAKLNGSAEKSEWKRRWEVRVFMAMCAYGAVAVVMRLGPSIPRSLRTLQTDANTTFVLYLITNLAILLEGMAQFAVFLAIDKGFRAGFRKAVIDKFRKYAGTTTVVAMTNQV